VAERVALSAEDKALLTLVQASLPLTRRPFAALGARVGLSEEEVLARLAAFKEAGLIRKLGPVFEPAALGLATELMAAEVASAQLDTVGRAVAAWDEVTHCYAREHRLNLWFAGVAAEAAWFARAAERVAAMDGVRGIWRLPTLRRFKISVQFDLTDEISNPTPQISNPPSLPAAKVDPDLLRVLQTDLPLVSEPFAALGEKALLTLRALLANGQVRRYGALVSHRKLGITANAMTLLVVPEVRIEEAGRRVASLPAVSHCYQRPTFAGFPYNLYAMIHGRAREECLAAAEEAARAAEASEWAALFSTHEYDKSSPDYAALLARRS
jgi:DNA-binding Lrp family transcriptional regulator